MITSSDAEHARLRRLTGPAFLNSGINEVAEVPEHFAELLCSQLSEAYEEGSQNLVEWFLWTLNDVIGKLALDQDFECLEKRRMHPWPATLMGALKQVAALNQFRRFGITTEMMAPLMTKRMIETRENFVNTARVSIDRRLAKEDEDPEKLDGQKWRPDIVGLMLREMKGKERLTDAEITANSVLIVGGGAETTSTCLSATVYHLCRTPSAMQKLKDEIRSTFSSSEDVTIRAVSNLPYLKATIDESLRIFPVASYITPRLTPKEGHVIDGEFIPGGVSSIYSISQRNADRQPQTYVSMGQWYMGRSDKFFDNPQEFRPERWLEEADTKGPAGLTSDEVLKPFSLGPRNCLGKL